MRHFRPNSAVTPIVITTWILLSAISIADQYGQPELLGEKDAAAVPGDPESGLTSQLRRPVALQLVAGESRLLIANRDSGSLSLMDVATKKVIAEQPIGKRLSDIVAIGDGSMALATDESAHELLLIDRASESPHVAARIAVAPFPVSVVFDESSRRAFVASLWSRQVTVVELRPDFAPADETTDVADKDPEPLKLVAKIDLPFAPRKQLLAGRESDKGKPVGSESSGQDSDAAGARKLIVADSLAGRLAIVDLATFSVDGEREFPAHNIRGLGVSADGRMLVVSHQMLNELANTIRNDVHWGLLMSNDLRWFELDRVVDVSSDLFDGAHMHPLGEAGNATADPQDLFVAADGRVVITLGGVGEIALGRERDFSLQRVTVGRRPVDVVVAADSQTAFVANMFDDSVSIVDLQKREETSRVSLGPRPKLTPAQRGELLFHDANLSHDGWMTCNSCHCDGHTNTFQNDNLSDLGFGAPKRVLSLLGVKDTAPYAWNGKVESLEHQIRNSIEKTMQSELDAKDEHVTALAAYLMTLESPPSVDRLRGTLDEAAVVRGEKLFTSLDCANCHAPPFYTSRSAYDVGVHDREGNREFNPPSLRGLSQRGPFLHDNQTDKYDDPPKAATLEDVFVKFRHQIERDLTDAELADLIAFLRSL